MMPDPSVQLPPYASSGGATIAAQTDRHVDRYRQRVSVVQREIAECEVAFEKALSRADAAAATRNRIDQLAADARRNSNR
jgi:hypothetical protein